VVLEVKDRGKLKNKKPEKVLQANPDDVALGDGEQLTNSCNN